MTYKLDYNEGIPGSGRFHALKAGESFHPVHRIIVEYDHPLPIGMRSVDSNEYKQNTVMFHWCKENLGPEDHFGLWFTHSLVAGLSFNFRNKEDAMRFKLAFG
jgi:hypothetical protein